MSRRTPSGPIRARLPGVLVVLLVLTSLAAAAVPAGAAPTDASGSTFVVAVDADGDAEVTLRLPIGLEGGEDSETVARVERNASALAEQFRTRLARVAAETESETGRSMAVSAASADVSTANSTVIVELSATWEGLAAVEGDRLVVSEPFDDGFRPPGRFVILAPEGYELTSSNPEPATQSGDSVAWAAGSSLDGFEATFAPSDGATSQSLPGFGFPAGVAAVALAAGASVLIARRRS